MQKKIYSSLLQYLIYQRNGYLLLAGGALLLNLLLALILFSAIGREKIIVVPAHLEKTFWLRGNQVAAEYLSEMSIFFVGLRFNLTEENVNMQRELLLRYVDPLAYEALKTELINEAQHIKKEHITTAFFPVEVKVNSEHLSALVIGDLVSTVGISQLPGKRLSYKIDYSYGNAKLLVKSFTEVKIHD